MCFSFPMQTPKRRTQKVAPLNFIVIDKGNIVIVDRVQQTEINRRHLQQIMTSPGRHHIPPHTNPVQVLAQSQLTTLLYRLYQKSTVVLFIDLTKRVLYKNNIISPPIILIYRTPISKNNCPKFTTPKNMLLK